MYSLIFKINKNNKKEINLFFKDLEYNFYEIELPNDEIKEILFKKSKIEHYTLNEKDNMFIVEFYNQSSESIISLLNKNIEYIKQEINQLDTVHNKKYSYRFNYSLKKKLSLLFSIFTMLFSTSFINYSSLSNEEEKYKIEKIFTKDNDIEENDVITSINENKNMHKESEDIVLKNDNSDLIIGLNISSECDSDEYFAAKENYYSVMEKYAKMYGVDPGILLAVAMQESRGIHNSNISKNGAIGIGQIQVQGSWNWNLKTLTAYNFETNSWDSVIVTIKKASEVENNIRYMAMILQKSIMAMNGNIMQGLQAYNTGCASVTKCLEKYSYENNIDINNVIENQIDINWINYMNLDFGDNKYIEHVLRFLPNDTIINIKGIPNYTNDCEIKFRYLSNNKVLRR